MVLLEQNYQVLCLHLNFDGVVIPLTFRTPGGLQNTTTLGTLLLNDRQWKNGSNSVYQGVVVKKAFIGDFTIVIKFGSEYSAHAMVCSPYASPLDFVLNSTNYYSSSGCLQNFQPSGSYSYSIPLHFYNSSTFYPGQNFASSSTTHYKYTRSGNYISLSYCNSGATGPWTLITSATIQTIDRVICLIGQCTAVGARHLIASIISEAVSDGLIVWLDGSDPLGTGTAPADNTTITSWADKSGSNKHCVPVTAGQTVQVYKATPSSSTPPSIISSNLALLLDAGNSASYSGIGNTWTDLSGNSNTGTLTNGSTYSNLNGGYIDFNGSDNMVSGTIAASTFSGAHTISCWFYRKSVVIWSGLFSNSVNVNNGSMLCFAGYDNLLTVFPLHVDGFNLAASVDLGTDSLNKWIYATIVYSGATNGSAVSIYAYKNGTLLTGTGSLKWDIVATSAYQIGHFDTGTYFNGYISNVAVYNRALTAAEIDQNYNSLKGRYFNTITKKGCVSFPGNVGIARVPFTANTFPYSSYTISVMCKVTSYDQATNGYIISGPVDPYNLYFGMWSNTFQIWNNSNWAGGTMHVTSVGTNATFPINNTWVHLSMTYTGGVIRPYVNGVAMNAINSTQNWSTTAPDIYIGGSPNNSGYNKLTMSVAELRIYNIVLSAVEIGNINSYLATKYLY